MQKKILFKILFKSMLFLSTCAIQAQPTQKSFAEAAEALVKKHHLPGFAAVIADTNGIIMKTSTGYADLENKKNYTLNSIQPIGSVSKLILAVSLMKAIELGYFTLDTEINQLLPFQLINPFNKNHSITIRELVTHSSGIVDHPVTYPNSYKFHFNKRAFSKEVLPTLAQLNFENKVTDTSMGQFFFNYLEASGRSYSKENFNDNSSGPIYSYSNIATALAAYLIEIKAGISYAAFTKKYIFEPLGMKQSSWFTNEVKKEDMAVLYLGNNAIPVYDLLTYPDGALKTSATDLSKFLVDMIRGLSGKSVLLSAAAFKTMFTPQFTPETLPKGMSLATRNRGVFWNLYNNGLVGHDGDDPGVSSFLAFNPTTGRGGLFICNTYLEDKSPLSNLIIATLAESKQ